MPRPAQLRLNAVADVLTELAEDIELLGGVLCADGALAQRHMQELQTIDLIAQKQRTLADLVRSDCAISALHAIGLEDLKLRLQQLATAATTAPPVPDTAGR